MRVMAGLLALVLLAPGGVRAADPTADAVAKARARTDPAAEIARLEAAVPAPRPDDVQSIDAIMSAVYASISGPAGTRDWDRFRSLMLPKARLTDSTVDARGRNAVRQWGVEDYIAVATPIFAKTPFFEQKLVNQVQRFGNIAQVFSSYASRSAPDAKPFQRGINSMQLLYDGKRWWVVSILWDADRPGNPLPPVMGG